MKSPEYPHNNEQRMSEPKEKIQKTESALSPELQKVVEARTGALSKIERYLRVKTREMLRAKLEREKKMFAELLQRDRKARALAQETTHILNRAYFKLKSLETNIFE